MATKETFCSHILKKYGLLVNFDGEHPSGWVPDPVDRETFGQWKQRVLGDDVENISVYVPVTTTSSRTLVSTVQHQSNAGHLSAIFGNITDSQASARKNAVEKVATKTKKIFTGLPRETLQDLVLELKHDLAPASIHFMQKFVDGSETEVSVEDLFRELLIAYDRVVKTCKNPVEQTETSLSVR